MNGPSIREWYARRIFKNIPFLLEHFDPRSGSFGAGQQLHQHCLRPLAWFFKHAAPGNPIHGDGSVLEKVIRAGDALVASEKASRHGGTLHGEWIPYNLLECCDWLGGELGNARKVRWREALARHIELQRQTSNYIATAPNHFIWRAAVWARAAKLFDQPAWLRAAQMLARQTSKLQTPDGYWDEAHRGHGPSPNYHRVHLHGLDLYYRHSGDEEVRPALERGIAFAVRAAYPDGTPIETFDGRQPYLAAFAAGMAAGAFTRTPEGRRLLRNQCARADELGCADSTHPCGFALTWYVFAGTDFMLDGCLFAEEGVEAPLPAERDSHGETFVMNGQAGGGGALTLRRGAWFAAVSAIESDVPRFIPNVYITERQTGFSIHHREAGLLAGGGNRMRNHVPLANAVLLTGWQDVDCRAGIFSAPFLDQMEQLAATQESTEQAPFATAGVPRPGHEGIDPVKGCYHPIRRHCEGTDRGARLVLEFMHGTVRFELVFENDRTAVIRYAYETCGAKKLLLQAPVPLFHPGRFALDGTQRQVGDLEQIESPGFSKQLALRARGKTVRYMLPVGAQANFTYPLEPIKNGCFKRMNYVPDERYQSLYTVGLISQEFQSEALQGELLRIEIE